MAGSTDVKFYKYDPSVPLAYVGAVVFAALAIGHIVQMFRFKTKYCIIFVIASLMDVVGFVARIISIHDQTARGPAIVSSIGLILPPVLSCAALYMIFGRFIHYVGDGYSFLKGKWVAFIFVVSDVVTFLIQVYGATALVNSNTGPDVDRGRKILLGGLILQVVSFGIFAIAILHFHYRTRRTPVTARPVWRPLLWALHANSALILVRSVFRIVEFSQVLETLETTEAYFYVFDSLLIAAATAVLIFVHPGNRIFPETPLDDGDGRVVYPLESVQVDK